MRLAMHRETPAPSPAVNVPHEKLEILYANLSDALHALAQPLTILRASLWASTSPGISATEHQRYLNSSAKQVDRACDLFRCLQEFVHVSKDPAACAPVELSNLLFPIIEDQKVLLHDLGAELKVVVPEGIPAVSIDKVRTEQALFAILQIANSLTAAGDVLEVSVFLRDERVEIVIQNQNACATRLTALDRLSLALAEAKLHSQQGEYEYSEGSFGVRLTLPIQITIPASEEEFVRK
jgi:signal transduction histidine kinase